MNPKYLYKYLPPERIDVLELLKISFSRPSWFNDPFELNSLEPEEMRLTEEAKSHCRERHNERLGIDVNETIERYFQKQHTLRMENAVGILCLSSNPNSLLMWAHYTNSHKGFLIEFTQSEHLWDSIGVPIKVLYEDERPTLDYDDDKNYFQHFHTKSKEWSYESEYRVVTPADELEEFKPIENLSLLMQIINPKCISRVFFGCAMNTNDKNKLKKILMNPALDHVELYQSVLHTREYALQYKKI
jgi:hypothetical protein